MVLNCEDPMTNEVATELEFCPCRNHTIQYQDILRRKRSAEDIIPIHIVLYTIFNPVYSTNSPSLKVLRIVMLKEIGIQTMVEVDCVEPARKAKEVLNGADIYSGCCTSKIGFEKLPELNVHNDDHESWDYANSKLGKPAPRPGRPYPLFAKPWFGIGSQLYKHSLRGQPLYPGGVEDGCGAYQNGSGSYYENERDNLVETYPMIGLYGRDLIYPSTLGPTLPQVGPNPQGPQETSVKITYGLNVQKVNPHKQPLVSEVLQSYPLPDGSLSFNGFVGNKNNRFISPAMTDDSRIQPPSKILHFINTPPNLTEDMMSKIFEDAGIKSLVTIKIIPFKTDRTPSVANIGYTLETLITI